MQAGLLETKLYRPKKLASFVHRSRLISMLDEGAKRKLTLVCAPPGFGKTTLLGDWAQGRDCPVAWLSLDGADNDPAVFLTYLVAAVRQMDGRIGAAVPAMIKSAQNLPAPVILAKLVGDIAAVDIEFILILDDYHTINNPSIHEGILFLIDHQPQNLHLVVAGRVDPPLPLARLRVREELMEVRADDLRFTRNEVGAFFNNTMRLALSPDEIASLDSRTEGWIASLQLAALSLKGREDKKGFVDAFSGSHRHIFDYLVDEVLSGLPENLQEFLLETSVLDRFSAPLSDYVLEISDSRSNLFTLERDNLFIVPLDDERRWFRYHHLFADFLNQRLKQKEPGRSSDLHRRAARWLAEQGFLDEAVRHSLAAEDFDLTAGLLGPQAINLVAASRVVPLLKWTAGLPEEAIAKEPLLATGQAWALLLTGRVAEVEKYLNLAESSLKESKDKALVEECLCHAMAIRSYVAVAVGDQTRAIELSLEALKLMPDDALVIRSAVTLNLAKAYVYTGRLDEAAFYMGEAIRAGEESGNYHVALAAYGRLADIMFIQGRFDEAAALLRTALNKVGDWGGGEPLPADGFIYLRLASLQFERNELESARSSAVKGIDLCEQAGRAEMLTAAYFQSSRIDQASGDLTAAKKAIAKAAAVIDGWTDSADSVERPAMSQRISSFEARISMSTGDKAAVRQWLSTTGDIPSDDIGNTYYFDKLTAAEAYIFTGQTGAALEILDRLSAGAESQGRQGHAVEILALKALAFGAAGERERALDELAQAIKRAEPQGRIRLFVDLGQPMLELLRELPDAGGSSEYVKKVIKAFQPRARAASTAPSSQPLIDPLSERELEVLRLVAEGLKYQEIADKLVVSLNTVRTHTKNVYSKLAVNSGSQAVKKATELGLL